MKRGVAKPYNGVPLRPRQLRAVGHVTAQWAFLETQIDFTLSALLALRRRKPEHYLIKPFKQRVRLWRDLVPKLVKDKATRDRLTTIMDRAAQLYHKRNAIVHGVWFQRRGESVATNLTYRQDETLRVKTAVVNTKGIEKVASDILSVSADLVDVVGTPQPEFLLLLPAKRRLQLAAYHIRPIPGTTAKPPRLPRKRGGG